MHFTHAAPVPIAYSYAWEFLFGVCVYSDLGRIVFLSILYCVSEVLSLFSREGKKNMQPYV